jgi:arginyl-tRNA synthetase
MGLFGRLKGKEGFTPKAPRDVGVALQASLTSSALVEETSIAGPGFVNVKVSRAVLADRISSMLAAGVSSWAPKLSLKKAVVDFSSPNVAKEMHVGHLRSTIIGDTLCRTLEFCGVDTVRLNHIGDWGTQFGMLIQHMAEGPGGLEADNDVADLMTLYREAKKRFDEEEDFKGRAREAVKRLQSGDAASLAAWHRICAASRKEFQVHLMTMSLSMRTAVCMLEYGVQSVQTDTN